jgi:hypothetical protein
MTAKVAEAPLVPAVVPEQPKPTETAWAAGCMVVESGWQKAVKRCFHGAGAALRAYVFEVGATKVKNKTVFGPWIVRSADGTPIDVKIDDNRFQWSNNGGKDWKKSDTVKLDRASIFVRVQSGSRIQISTDADFSRPQNLSLAPDGSGFGVNAGALIRNFRPLN